MQKGNALIDMCMTIATIVVVALIFGNVAIKEVELVKAQYLVARGK